MVLYSQLGTAVLILLIRVFFFWGGGVFPSHIYYRRPSVLSNSEPGLLSRQISLPSSLRRYIRALHFKREKEGKQCVATICSNKGKLSYYSYCCAVLPRGFPYLAFSRYFTDYYTYVLTEICGITHTLLHTSLV